MNRLPAFAIVVALLASAVFLLAPAGAAPPPPTQKIITSCSQSISTAAPVVSLVAGKRLVIEAAVLRSSSAGVVVFTDGAAGDVLARIYLAQDSNLVLDDRVLGTETGIRGSAGTGIYATLSGATLTGTFRVKLE